MSMSINHTILGLLSIEPMTGYDLKKVIQDSPFMYWSGNNNQIYKALVQLSDQGYVTNEVIHQDGSPTKKIYSLTKDGQAELTGWAESRPELPETKKPFLIQLAWSGSLDKERKLELISEYEREVEVQLKAERLKRGKKYFHPARTATESSIWDLIYDNVEDSFESELAWIRRVQKVVMDHPDEPLNKSSESKKVEAKADSKERDMNYQIKEKGKTKYILLLPTGKKIESLQDGLDIVSICMEHGIEKVLISGERLTDDFMRLSTKIAGEIVQKFTQYNIQAVVVLDEARTGGRFKEFMTESNVGKVFRTYNNYSDAEGWLLR